MILFLPDSSSDSLSWLSLEHFCKCFFILATCPSNSSPHFLHLARFPFLLSFLITSKKVHTVSGFRPVPKVDIDKKKCSTA